MWHLNITQTAQCRFVATDMNSAYSLFQVTDFLSACLLFLWSRWNIVTVSVWIRPIPCFKLPIYCLHASYSYGQDEISRQYQYEFGLLLASSYRFIVCMPPILMVKVKYRDSISMNLAYSLLQVTDLLSACLLFLWSRWNIVTVSVWIRPIPCFKLPIYCLHASYSYG